MIDLFTEFHSRLPVSGTAAEMPEFIRCRSLLLHLLQEEDENCFFSFDTFVNESDYCYYYNTNPNTNPFLSFRT